MLSWIRGGLSVLLCTFECLAVIHICRIGVWSLDEQFGFDLGWISHVVRLLCSRHGPLRSGHESLEGHKNIFLRVTHLQEALVTEPQLCVMCGVIAKK